jgi:peptide/nickel transport system permease protein
VARGDLGISWISRHPVATLLRQSATPTVQLAFGALVLALVIALPAGVFAAFRENSWWDFVLTSVSIAGAAMPHFWLGILLILLFGLTLGWFPPSGYAPIDKGLLPNLKSIALPALTLSVGLAAIVARQTRSSLLDIIRQEYVRTARAKGLPEQTVIWKHTVRNGLIPIITVTGLQIGRLMSGAVVTETIFSIPGVGRLMVDAVLSRDWPIVQVTMLFAAGLVLSANLLVDITYALVDPRIRYE